MAGLGMAGIALTTIGMRNYIEKHGKYPEGDE